jgi:Na+-driven multidrug efflux pump
MVGHLDTDYLAASSAALVWMNIISAFLYRSFGSALNTLCAQALGKQIQEIIFVFCYYL